VQSSGRAGVLHYNTPHYRLLYYGNCIRNSCQVATYQSVSVKLIFCRLSLIIGLV
jgi:hypothetical protein